MKEPLIIQGGMGAGVSCWGLAKAVSREGHLGVVSGTALDVIVARHLQLGDVGGHRLRSFQAFPDKEMARRVYERYYVEGGKPADKPFKATPVFMPTPQRDLQELAVVTSFSETYLAKEGHSGPVGINLLEKIQLPILWTLYGAMLAGVDYVLMGAGIPREIPGALDRMSNHEEASLKLNVAEAQSGDDHRVRFDPRALTGFKHKIKRPRFLAIIASHTLAQSLAKKANGYVDGFVVEGPTAGGHNAPPRGPLQMDGNDEPVYGDKDVVDLRKMRELDRPFWLAGGFANPKKLLEALKEGAKGIQAGTAFALCMESGIDPQLKENLINRVKSGLMKIKTDARASSSGFPFKVALMPESLSDEAVYKDRNRICDLGYLRSAYSNAAGAVGMRCSAEPEKFYLKKGGKLEDTVGRKCLCNGLLATIGLAQRRPDGYVEPPIFTAGNDFSTAFQLLKDKASYTAREVIEYLTSELSPQQLEMLTPATAVA